MAERSLKWLTDLLGGSVDEAKVEKSIGPIYPTPDGKPISSPAPDMTRLQAVKNWSHPFKQKNKVSVIDQLTQLANATAGYYPLGAGGLWHGGVHFDSGTAGVLDQSSVVCIADGEVVAYRIDMNSAVTSYVQNKKPMPKPFSRNFVLVRHRLEAPRIQGNDNSPPSLIIYSLYMHLEDGAVYQSTPTLARPGFWEKKGHCLVPMTAKDVDPDQPGKLGLNVRHQEKGGVVIDLLPQGTLVRVSGEGAYRRLEDRKGPARLVGADGTLLGYVRFDQLEPTEGGDYRAKARLTVYDEINSKHGVRKPDLPKGTQVKISGEGELRKLEGIAQFVHFDSLQALPVPGAYDEICVLDKPVSIKAGALIGHIGQYQDYAAAQPERKLHLEVFSDGDVERFIALCRTWEQGLPAKDKTWLKLAKGTVVVAHKDHFGEKRPPTQHDERQLSDADLIVPKSLLDGLPSTHKIAVSEAGERNACNWYRLEGLLNNAKHQLLDGWVRVEKGAEQWKSPWAWEGYEVITDYTAPPEFMAASLRSLKRLTDEQLMRFGPMADAGDTGPIKKRLFDLIDRNGDRNITVGELRAIMRIPAHAQALSRLIIYCESEWYYKPQKWDVLDEILGHAGSTPHINWLAEKERIKQLSWWSDLAAKLWLPADGRAYHFNPMGLLVNLGLVDDNDLRWLMVRRGQVTFDAEGNDYPGNRYFSRVLHWPGGKSGVTLGRGYDMKHRTADDVLFDLISAGTEYEAAKRFSEGAKLFGSSADEFVRRNKTAYGVLTLRQQNVLFEDVVYPVYEKSAKNRYRMLAAKMKSASPSWEELDSRIRDIAVDFTYHQGSIFESQLPYIASNDRQSLANYIMKTPSLKQYESGRRRAIYLIGKDN